MLMATPDFQKVVVSKAELKNSLSQPHLRKHWRFDALVALFRLGQWIVLLILRFTCK